MLKTTYLLKLSLIFIFGVVTISSSLAFVGSLSDKCENSFSNCDHFAATIVSHILPVNLNPESDTESSDHRHSCCHNQNFLLNNSTVSFLANNFAHIGLSPYPMISDPHPRRPIQPPRV